MMIYSIHPFECMTSVVRYVQDAGPPVVVNPSERSDFFISNFEKNILWHLRLAFVDV